MFGELTNTQVEELLHKQILGRIGCHADGVTYIVPISYAYDGRFIYGHTFEGMKMRMMRRNPRICFEVDDTSNMANWQSVIAWGVMEELPEGPTREDAIRKLEKRAMPVQASETAHLSSQWPFPSEMEEVPGIIFRVALEQKTGRFEKSNDAYFFAT